MSWEWIMCADGQVFYRLTEVNGQRERNPWTLATRLPAPSLRAGKSLMWMRIDRSIVYPGILDAGSKT